MKDYRDTKPMKRSGHHFMADGGFTGSAGAQSVRSYQRKPSVKPSKPDFARRAKMPGGLADGGQPHKTTVQTVVKGGQYAKGGVAKHSDVAMDKKLVKASVHKHERGMHPGKPLTKLASGGLSANYKCGGKVYSRKPMVGK